MEYKRSQRVAELVRHQISDIIARELKDPGVGMVSITKVQITDDLRHAKIYVSVLGDEATSVKSLAGLSRAGNFIRSSLGKHTDLRVNPELSFVRDDSAEYAQNIDVLLNKIERERKE